MFRILENETVIAFWTLGILNNMPYVVMIAGAKSISEGGTALVFVSNVLPSLCIKLSAPYWFDKVSYSRRISVASLLMSASFLTVALFGYLESKRTRYYDDTGAVEFNFNIFMQLIGVGLCSAQGGLGEASLLALSGRVDNIVTGQGSDVSDDSEYDTVDERRSQIRTEQSSNDRKSLNIAAFSSGTGLAGVCGFLYIFIATKIIELSLAETLVISLIFPFAYWKVYELKLAKYTVADATLINANEQIESSRDRSGINEMHPLSIEELSDSFLDNPVSSTDDTSVDSNGLNDIISNNSVDIPNCPISISERITLTLSLWKYMVPLFVVYATEYAMQSGIWTAIGFPVDSVSARNTFYVASNWMYQLGVFLSRSSGAFFTAPMWMLWLMPLIQTMNLIFFYFVAMYKIFYNYVLLLPAFFVGLLGGAVYVSGYQRINKDMPLHLREIALSTSSLADSCGILLADVSGLFIQACIYQHHEIDGSLVKCPI